MNKKKINSVLKSMAAAGLAIGGISSIQGADMVMAATMDESTSEETTQEAGKEVASTSTSVSENQSESTTETPSDSVHTST